MLYLYYVFLIIIFNININFNSDENKRRLHNNLSQQDLRSSSPGLFTLFVSDVMAQDIAEVEYSNHNQELDIKHV